MLLHLILGSNIEPKQEHLKQAAFLIDAIPHASIMGCSRIYETPAIEMAGDSAHFLNLCIALRTSLKAQEIFTLTSEIEVKMGRSQSSKGTHRPRLIDIDLVLAESLILNLPELQIPHPGLLTRSFFLWPLLEICPGASDPRTKQALKYLLPGEVSPPILRTFPGFNL